VKRLTEAHGGEVSVDSVLGEGTRFTVRLPATPQS
jgi:signal transduction histidine kinase